jgi:hypothetical protein
VLPRELGGLGPDRAVEVEAEPAMVIKRLSDLVSGFRGGFSLVLPAFVLVSVVSGYFRDISGIFQGYFRDISGIFLNGPRLGLEW